MCQGRCKTKLRCEKCTGLSNAAKETGDEGEIELIKSLLSTARALLAYQKGNKVDLQQFCVTLGCLGPAGRRRRTRGTWNLRFI